jgi:hypothetical protein
MTKRPPAYGRRLSRRHLEREARPAVPADVFDWLPEVELVVGLPRKRAQPPGLTKPQEEA